MNLSPVGRTACARLRPGFVRGILAGVLACNCWGLALAQSTYDWNVGSGIWNTTDANWTGAGSTWVDGTTSNAVFNNTDGATVTISGSISAGDVSFGDASANRSWTLSGGTLAAAGNLAYQGFNSNGGDYGTNPALTINSDVSVTGSTLIGRSTLSITGGTFVTDRITSNPASADWGRFQMTGGSVTATNGIDGTYGTDGSNGTTATFDVLLQGGTLSTTYLKVADREVGTNNNAWLTFNGTTVRPLADNSDFVQTYGGGNNAFIAASGALFDTNSFDIGVNASLTNYPGQTGFLVKQGSGTLTLSGANTYTGGTTLSGGTLRLDATAALGAGGLSMAGGTTLELRSDSDATFLGGDGLGGLGGASITIDVDQLTSGNTGKTLSFAPSGFNTFQTTIDVTGGNDYTLSLGRIDNGFNGPLALNAVSANLVLGDIGASSAVSSLAVGGASNTTISGAVATNGGLGKSGVGTLTLSGTSTYTGVTTLAGGTVNAATIADYGTPSSLGDRASADDQGESIGLLFQGGTLQYTGSTPQSTNRAIRLSTTGGGGTIDASGSDPSATLTFSATSSPNFFENPGNRTLTFTGSNTGANTFAMAIGEAGGTTSVVKTGGGRWVLSGESTYSGVTTLSGGTLNATTIANNGVASSLGVGTGDTDGNAIGLLFRGGTLQYTGSTAQATDRAIRLSTDGGGGTIDASGSDPSATLTFTRTSMPNWWENGGSRTLTLTGTNTGANTIVAGIDDIPNVTTITVIKAGPGTWVLEGASTYLGGTQFNGGTLSVSAISDSGSSNIGNSGSLSFNGGTLLFTGASGSTARPIAFTGPGTIDVASGSSLTTTGGWSGNGGFTKAGAGAVLVGANAGDRFTIDSSNGGAFTMAAGTFTIPNTTAYFVLGDDGSTSTYAQTGGTFNADVSEGVYIGNGANSQSTMTISGGTFNFTTGNRMRLGQAADSVGTLNIGGGGGTATASLTSINFSEVSASAQGFLNLDANGLLNVGQITRGAGAGTITFDGGTLQARASEANFMAGLTAATIDGGGATIDSNGFDISVGQPLGGSGTLTKIGSGVLTLSGASTFTGATAVNAGTLRVTGSLASGSAVSVASGATLGGSGTIGGPVSVLSGGILSPGTSPGTLTIGNTLALDSASILAFEIDASSTSPGSLNDLITGVTNLTLGGTLNLAGTGDFSTVAQGTTWRLIDYSGSLTDNTLTIGTAPTLAAGLSFAVDTSTANQVNLSVVPEPGSLGLAALGLAAAGWLASRRLSRSGRAGSPVPPNHSR